MNIFKALSQGDGSINETNVTSFLSYILNETNSFSSSFLLLFLQIIEEQLDGIQFQGIIKFKGKNLRQKINNFESNYTYSAIPEYRLKYNGKIRDVDILLTISEKFSENDCCYFLIENKIKKSAIKTNQCAEQYQLLKKDDDFQENVPIFSILITPDLPTFSSMIEVVKEINSLSVWLKWESDSGNSMIEVFRNLLKLENDSYISPIESNTQYILKSFIDYISSELTIKDKSMNFSIAGSKVVEQAEFESDNEKYFLKRFDNKMIRLFDKNDEIVEKAIKPVLRKIIKTYNLDVDLFSQTGRRKNTQILGRDVIRALNAM